MKAIATLTESDSTALWMSRCNIDIPIVALTWGEPMGKVGGTNALKIMKIGQH